MAVQLIKDKNMQYKCRWGYKTPPRTKLDSVYSDEDKEDNKPVSENIINEDDRVSSSEDTEDVVFQKTVLPTCTCNFDIDFPPSPKVPKGGKVKSKKNGGITQNSPQQSKTLKNTHKEKSDDVALDGNGKKRARSVTQEGKEQGIQNVGDLQEGNNGENNSDTYDTADDFNLNGNIRPSGTVKSGNIICHLFDTIQ